MSVTFAGWLRLRVEGLCFFLLIPWLLLTTLIARLLSLGSSPDREVWSRTLGRWSRFVWHGLRDLREVWWIQLSLEPALNVWRYVFLLEWIERLNFVRPVRQTESVATGKHYVVYVPGHIGDVLHAVPLLRELKKQTPQGSITLIVGPWSEALASTISYVDDVMVYAPHFVQYYRDKNEWDWSLLREMARLMTLRRLEPDVFISTIATDLPTLLLGQTLGASTWVGFEPQQELYSSRPLEKFVLKDNQRLQAESLMDLLQAIGLQSGDARLEFTVGAAAEQEADRRLALQGIGRNDKFVALAPGAGWPGKMWPPERFSEIIDRLAEERRIQSFLLGSKDDSDIAHQVLRSTIFPARNYVGVTSLPLCAAILKRASLLICNDSGLLHIAAALGVPTLSLFGPTQPAQWAPRGSQHRFLRAVESCPECHPWHPRAKCRQNNKCMKAITAAQVRAAVDELLK